MATSYLRKKIVDLLTNNGTYVSPTLFLALFSADPGDSGSLASEIVGGAYVRVPLAGLMGAADAVTGIALNSSTINFPIAAAQWNVVALAFCDALTAGNVLQVGHPSTPKIVNVGGRFQLSPGQLKLRVR